MHHGNNNDDLFLHTIVHAKRETEGQRTARVAVQKWVQSRLLRNLAESPQNLIKELIAQAWPLLLVPTCRFFKVLLCFGTNSKS